MEYVKKCAFCKKTYTSGRSHSNTCSGACRLSLFKIKRDFELLIADVPEEEVKCKYNRIVDEGMCYMIYLHWYNVKVGNERKRFADVYLPKSNKKGKRCSPADMMEKIKKMKCVVTKR